MIFNRASDIVGTEIYRDMFRLEGNRAMLFAGHDEIPVNELKLCILLSREYHRIKLLPMHGQQKDRPIGILLVLCPGTLTSQ